MKFFLFIPALWVFVYLLSFAKYNWDRRNKMAAMGTIIIAIAAISIPFFIR